MTDQSERLEQVAEDIKTFSDSPLYTYREENNYQPVPGEGSPDSKIMLIGEAPGKKEAQTGRPFVGSGGQLLDELLASIDLNREDVFITNLLKDRPPENRDPKPEDIKAYEPFLWRQIEILQPRLIVTLGRFAMHFMLDAFHHPKKDHKIGEVHGSVFQGKADYGPVYLLPLYHPAAALYNQSLKPDMEKDMKVLKGFLEKEDLSSS